jgi:hypothetical protein
MKFAFGFALLFMAVTARAQKQPILPDSCIYRIPASSLKRVPVFLQATADSQKQAVLPSADLFAQSVAFKIREILGAKDSHLVEADSVVAWSRLWGEVNVTLHKNGNPTWSVPEWSMRADTIQRSSVRLLVQAISQVISDGEMVPYPDGVNADSIAFSLSLVNPTVTEKGKILPVEARQPIPVFSIAVAWERSVSMIKQANIEYPKFSRSINSVGGVRLTYVVNQDGRMDPETIKEVWPEGVARPTGNLLKSYEAFLAAVKKGLPSARYAPAMVGGCPLKQVVNQWIEFKIP